MTKGGIIYKALLLAIIEIIKNIFRKYIYTLRICNYGVAKSQKWLSDWTEPNWTENMLSLHKGNYKSRENVWGVIFPNTLLYWLSNCLAVSLYM